MKKRKKKPKQIITQSIDDYLAQGGGIKMLPKPRYYPRLLYSSGHFGPKNSQKRK
jgi:hypothetical protein